MPSGCWSEPAVFREKRTLPPPLDTGLSRELLPRVDPVAIPGSCTPMPGWQGDPDPTPLGSFPSRNRHSPGSCTPWPGGSRDPDNHFLSGGCTSSEARSSWSSVPLSPLTGRVATAVAYALERWLNFRGLHEHGGCAALAPGTRPVKPMKPSAWGPCSQGVAPPRYFGETEAMSPGGTAETVMAVAPH
jgi:hypothetical protein